jgi:hypothetical protein
MENKNIKIVQYISLLHKDGTRSEFKKDDADLVLSMAFDSNWINIEYSNANRQIRGVLIPKTEIETISYVEDLK